MTLEQAAYEMRLVDHDFYLFTDRATGQDSVLVRGGDGARESVEVAGPPPTLTETQARERLDVGGEPFVFHLDPVDRRGRVLYRRYDGHYGLIVGTSSAAGEPEA
jgi:hypothetical protein